MKVAYTIFCAGRSMVFAEMNSDAVGQHFYINNAVPAVSEWAAEHVKLDGVMIFRTSRFAGALAVKDMFFLCNCESSGGAMYLYMGREISSSWGPGAEAFGFPQYHLWAIYWEMS